MSQFGGLCVAPVMARVEVRVRARLADTTLWGSGGSEDEILVTIFEYYLQCLKASAPAQGHPKGTKGDQSRPKGAERHVEDTQGKSKGTRYTFTNSRSTAQRKVVLNFLFSPMMALVSMQGDPAATGELSHDLDT